MYYGILSLDSLITHYEFYSFTIIFTPSRQLATQWTLMRTKSKALFYNLTSKMAAFYGTNYIGNVSADA